MQANEFDVKTKAQWQSLVIANPKNVIVDFHADWCPPCQKLKPVLHDALAQSNGKWVLAKVNVDETDMNDISGQYAAEGIPAVYLFQGGKPTDQFLGFDQTKANQLIAKAQQ